MIYIKNRATNSFPGSCLPFYDSPNYVFSALNEEFNDTNGLWKVPSNKIPTFQVWLNVTALLPTPSITTFRYLETRGNNDFTGVVFTPPSGVNLKATLKDGVQYYVLYTLDSGNLITPAPESRWIIELTFTQEGQPAKTIYSEEFITFDCC